MNEAPGEWPPPESFAFEIVVRVRFHELDALGHVNNAAYLNYIEQAAIDHASFLGLGMDEMRELGGVFVARRHEMDYLRPAVGGDILRVVTWLGRPRGARIERSYLVLHEPRPSAAVAVAGRLLLGAEVPRNLPAIARVRTEWVFVDSSGHPRRIPAQVITRFDASNRIAANGARADVNDR